MKPTAEKTGRADRIVPDMRVDFDVETPMRGGTVLRCDIYRPTGDQPVPVILHRTPYDKRVNHSLHMGLDARAAAARGYALAVQDVRGRFASEGDFLLTPTQAVEGPDGYDTIEWLAKQSWCSGAIGMIGSSYGSLTQLMAACERPPSLRAIVPEKTGFPSRGAVLLDSILIAWTAGQALDWLQKAMLRQEAGEKETRIIQQALKDPQAAARHLPLNDMPLRQIGGLLTFQQVIDLLQKENSLAVASIGVPVLIVSGWYDMSTPETARIYEILRERTGGLALNDEANIVFGPWDHNTGAAAVGELFFSPFANTRLAEIPKLYLDFYDRHLKGDTSKPAPGAKYFMMGANEWRAAPAWPPPHRMQSMFMHSAGHANSAKGDGRLGIEPPPADMVADRYRYDPLDPVPSIGGRYFEAGGSRPGPYDQRRVEERKDVLVYTGDSLESPLEIAGPVKARVFVSCSTLDTDLVVKLCDVRPDGISYNILDEHFRCRWREGFGKTALFKSGEIYEFEIDIGPVAHRFKAGHRVRFQLTSSSFPHFDRNMNTGNPIGSDAGGPVADVTLYHDTARPSRVTLPVVLS